MTIQHALAAPSDHGLSIDELEDNDLLQMTRQGSSEAYAVLYDRYIYGARRLARHLGQREESDDVVSDAFAQIFDLLQRGKGPDRAFRAYLFTSIRHECGRRAKASKRVMPTDDDAQIDTAVPFGDGNLDDFEKNAIRAAYESLPDRWRTVLWHLDVEGRKPNELADVLGLKPNSVSALVYRARSGLREAYLQQHVGTTDAEVGRACSSTRGHLAAVVRRTATSRDQEKVHAHLETCDACMAAYLDLQEVNREVGAIVTPVALAAAIGGGSVLAATASGGALLANVVGGIKGLLVTAAVPAAAVAVTGAAVISASAPSSAPVEAPDRPVSSTIAPVTTVAHSAAEADDKAPATAAAVEAPKPGAAGALPTAAPTRTAPATTPAASPGSPAVDLDLGPAKVAVGPDAIEVTAGPIVVSTKPVKDLLETVAPKTTTALGQVLGAAAK
ncbi:sigma-70 family RNA polymerase sigma factor [Aeromicrobium stalagmiti]|uniref:sigma-70 family RNA polymerase sigma factor n=1 Tax=Aeromicrobium stalagmiti TaxID=2738988 RepID=UPI00156A57D6|nr:sigma-70 family RNA polymerase sigma factor [Aeromicrobium stalagmiti]